MRRASTRPASCVPGNLLLHHDLRLQVLLDFVARYRCREEDAALGAPVVEVGRHDELGVGQGVRHREHGAAAIPEEEARGAGSPLRDAIGPGERQEQAGIIAARRCVAHTELAAQRLRLSANPLHRVPGDAGTVTERRNPPLCQQVETNAQVGIGGASLGAQDVPLLHQGRDVGGEWYGIECARADNHVTKPWMQAERGELLAVLA